MVTSHPMNRFALILPAAGSGTRFGAGDKLLVSLAGRSVLQRSVALFADRDDIAQIVIPTAPDRFDAYRELLASCIVPGRLTFVPGGSERWQSVHNGLRAVHAKIPFVAIHDAARPLTPQSVIDAAFQGAVATGGSVPVVLEPATLKRIGPDEKVVATVDRRGLYQAQTPQCFERARLLEAFEGLIAQNRLAGITDDAEVFERMGWPVAATPGCVTNLKITTAEDTELARAILALG